MGIDHRCVRALRPQIVAGLKASDDRTSVAAVQSMDRAIIKPWFMLTGFLGALVLTLAAVLTHLVRDPFRGGSLGKQPCQFAGLVQPDEVGGTADVSLADDDLRERLGAEAVAELGAHRTMSSAARISWIVAP